jgi:hypothetical protein
MHPPTAHLVRRTTLNTQVDVTAQGDAASQKAPVWTKTASDEALRVKQGNQTASLISNALQNMGWGASPWAKLQGQVMRIKPHKVGREAGGQWWWRGCAVLHAGGARR